MKLRAAIAVAITASFTLATYAVAEVKLADAARSPRDAKAVPLRVQVGQLIATGFPGTTAPAWLRQRLDKGELSGVVLFGANVRTRQQVHALDEQLQRAAHNDALIALDQEGGEVRRFS